MKSIYNRQWRSLAGPSLGLLGLVLVFAGLAVFSRAAQVSNGDNIAPLTPYELSPAPNYALATGLPDKVLTDGRRAGGSFWVGPDSVGWSWKSPIIYRQMFKAKQAIRRIEIGSGQALPSEISLPANAFVYVNGEDDRWAYIGDAAQSVSRVADGPHTLSLDFEPVEARAVAIVIYRAAPYIFLDEVRILAAATGSKIAAAIETGNVISDAKLKRQTYAELRAGIGPIGANPAARTAWPLDSSVSYERDCRVSRIAPWTEGDPVAISRAELFDGVAMHAVAGWLVGLVRIENSSHEPIKVELTRTRISGVETPEIFIAQYVLALDYRWRADVLAPTQGLVVPPRSMSLLFVRARITTPGEVNAEVEVACADERKEIAIAGRAVGIENVDRPYGNTWSYLRGPLRHLSQCRSKIQDDAWIDTAVVESSALTPRRGAGIDKKLRSYLRSFATSRRLLLFMDLTDAAWTPENGSRLEDQLGDWWAWVSHAISDEGYRGEVLFYPFDEITNGQFARMDAAVQALRRIAPSVPIYATIDNMTAAQSVSVDVRQFHDRILTQLLPTAPLGRSPQIYATAYYSKALGLSTYYRRLGWLAFGAEWEGAGVWSMWDANGADQPQSGWSDFGGIERDFNLVYADTSGCPLPSRRLMAFQRGLEDFALMRACKRRSGLSQIGMMARATAQSDQWATIRHSANQSAPAFDAALAQIFTHCDVGSD
jgi:hypothetical protein